MLADTGRLNRAGDLPIPQPPKSLRTTRSHSGTTQPSRINSSRVEILLRYPETRCPGRENGPWVMHGSSVLPPQCLFREVSTHRTAQDLLPLRAGCSASDKNIIFVRNPFFLVSVCPLPLAVPKTHSTIVHGPPSMEYGGRLGLFLPPLRRSPLRYSSTNILAPALLIHQPPQGCLYPGVTTFARQTNPVSSLASSSSLRKSIFCPLPLTDTLCSPLVPTASSDAFSHLCGPSHLRYVRFVSLYPGLPPEFTFP